MRFSTPIGPVLVIGEVLFDVFPDQRRLGGAPFNVAWHLHQMRVPVLFVSRVGDDDAGREILDFARSAGFPTEGIQIDRDHPTGEVRVQLDENGGHRFEILPDRAYDYLEMTPWLQAQARRRVPLVYFGTLIQRHEVSAALVQEAVRLFQKESTLMVDLNLRPPFYNREVVARTLDAADLLKLNDEELIEVKKLLGWSGKGREIIQRVLLEFHLGNICLTMGPEGSLWFAAGKPEPWRQADLVLDDFVDSVGAGDAFAAVMALGFLANWPRQTILDQASAFAGRICTIPGALPSDPSFYDDLRLE